MMATGHLTRMSLCRSVKSIWNSEWIIYVLIIVLMYHQGCLSDEAFVKLLEDFNGDLIWGSEWKLWYGDIIKAYCVKRICCGCRNFWFGDQSKHLVFPPLFETLPLDTGSCFEHSLSFGSPNSSVKLIVSFLAQNAKFCCIVWYPKKPFLREDEVSCFWILLVWGKFYIKHKSK